LRLPVLAQRRHEIDFSRHLARMFEQLFAKLGQHQATGGALHYPFSQPGFQLRDTPRHGRFRQAEAFGGAAEAAGFGNARKDQQVIGV
jgi:hypothetical protein